MSRSEPELDDEPMSPGASATLALSAPWRLVCRGCGQSPEYLAPLEAVALTHILERRCARLLHHPQASLTHRYAEPGSWSALEPAGRVLAVLGAADIGLRDLLGEDTTEAVSLPPATQPERPLATLTSLAETVRNLIATIEAATTQDWERTRPETSATASEMVWLALHDATHHLEDAELVLDAALANGPAAWGLDGNQPDQ